MDFQEGEIVSVPCRHCGSVSIGVLVKAGATTHMCPKCQAWTKFTIDLAEEWQINSAAIGSGPRLPETPRS